jgi:subtilase family serine protease
MALDALATLDTEFKRLDKQVKQNKNYESEWNFPQLVRIFVIAEAETPLLNISFIRWSSLN